MAADKGLGRAKTRQSVRIEKWCVEISSSQRENDSDHCFFGAVTLAPPTAVFWLMTPALYAARINHFQPAIRTPLSVQRYFFSNYVFFKRHGNVFRKNNSYDRVLSHLLQIRFDYHQLLFSFVSHDGLPPSELFYLLNSLFFIDRTALT